MEQQSKKQANEANKLVEELVVYQSDPNMSSISSPSTGSNTTDDNSESQDLSNAMFFSSKAGRPKGSTRQKKRANINNYKECVNAIAEVYQNELTLHKDQNKRVKKGYLDNIIEQKKEEFGLSCNISAETVRSRIKRGS